MLQTTPSRIFALALIAWAGAPYASRACNVPVFRYAMERWTADPYQIVIYHRTGQEGAALALLRNRGANCSLKPVDAGTPEGQSLAARRNIPSYPWVEVYFPAPSAVRAPVWSGPLDARSAGNILHSPARSLLARRLLGGEVAVWILVNSGREDKDRRARESLQTHLARASATLRIPETGMDIDGNPIEVPDFKTYPVSFGLVEVTRADRAEDLLVSALLKSEPDLERYDEPVAFPVFGRGRALYALVGDGIDEKNIREACVSMLAWCSCEIKAQNPGTDLLIAADWSRPFGGRMVKDPPPALTGLDGFLPAPKPAAPAAPRRAPEPPPQPAVCEREPAGSAPAARAPEPQPHPPAGPNPLARNILYAAGAAGAVLLVLSLFLSVRGKR